MSKSLNVPEYWSSTEPQAYDLTLFDVAYLRNHFSGVKYDAHSALCEDLNILLQNEAIESDKYKHLKRLQKQLKKSHVNETNVSFWTTTKRELSIQRLNEIVEEFRLKSATSRALARSFDSLVERQDNIHLRSREKEWDEESSYESSSCSYESSESDTESSYDVLAGGDRSCKVWDDEARWTIDRTDITELLMNYRAATLKKAARHITLSTARMLSLNFVFLLTDSQISSATANMGRDIHKKILHTFVNVAMKKHRIVLPPEARRWAMTKIDRTMTRKEQRLLTKKRLLESEELGEEAVILAELIHRSCMRMYKDNDGRPEIEDTFVHRHLSDLLNVVFDLSDVVHSDWANKAMDTDKGKLNDIKFKPDYIVYVSRKHKRTNLFAVEVKPVFRNGGGMNDTVKLGFEMKLMIDILVEQGVVDPVVCGLVVKGHCCEGYILDLNYEAIYRMTKCCEFKLPKTFTDLPLLAPAVEAMLQIKNYIEATATRISDKETDRTHGLCMGSKHFTPKSYRRQSFSGPKQIRKDRRADP